MTDALMRGPGCIVLIKGEAHGRDHGRRASQIMEKTVKSRSEAQDKESAEN
jgi:hypothetical protein